MRYAERKFDRRAAAMLAVIVLLFTAAVLFIYLITSNGYHDEASFISYASNHLRDQGHEKSVGRGQKDIRYGKTASVALSFPVLKTSLSNKVIRRETGTEEAAFMMSCSGLKGDKYRACMLTGWNSFRTPFKAVGVVLITTYRATDGNGRNMSVKASHVSAFNFSTESGADVRREKIFRGDFSKTERGLIRSALRKKYGGKLLDDWEKKADPEGQSAAFVLTESGIRYYFDDASVVGYACDHGVASCDIKYSRLKGYLCDDIGESDIDLSKKMIALTFDDGPSRFTAKILDVLKRYNVKATFFEVGRNIDGMPGSGKLLRRELAQGCEIGSHSYSHKYLTTLKKERAAAEVKRGNEAIRKATGQYPTLFRPPGGLITQELEDEINLPCIMWSVDTRDWANRNAEKTLRNVMGQKDLDGRVVLMHSLYPSTVQALKKMIPALQKKGYQFVTVSDMIEYRYKDEIINNKIYGGSYFTLRGAGRE